MGRIYHSIDIGPLFILLKSILFEFKENHKWDVGNTFKKNLEFYYDLNELIYDLFKQNNDNSLRHLKQLNVVFNSNINVQFFIN